jgi:hypothetical protein
MPLTLSRIFVTHHCKYSPGHTPRKPWETPTRALPVPVASGSIDPALELPPLRGHTKLSLAQLAQLSQSTKSHPETPGHGHSAQVNPEDPGKKFRGVVNAVRVAQSMAKSPNLPGPSNHPGPGPSANKVEEPQKRKEEELQKGEFILKF